MTRSTTFILTIAFASATPPIHSTGTVYYVGKSGNDSYSCAQAKNPTTPKLTIKAGMSCLAGGDTLVLKAGTYNETIHVTGSSRNGTSWANPTRIISETRGAAVILLPAGALAAIVVHGDNKLDTANDPQYIEFDGLALQGPNIDKYGGGAIHIDKGAKHIRFKNGFVRDFLGDINTVSCFGAVPDPVTGKDLYFPTNCEIINSEFNNNLSSTNVATGAFKQCFYVSGGSFVAKGNRVTGCRGIAFRVERLDDPAVKTIIEDNVLWNNESVAIQVRTPGAIVRNNVVYASASKEWAGIRILGDDISVVNNTVYGNTHGGILIGTEFNAAKNNRVLNNIAVANGGFSDVALYGSGHVVDYNIIQKPITNLASGVSIGTNNKLGVDPKFMNVGSADFRLLLGSPAIDSGVALSDVPTDSQGVSRPRGVRYDMGAFEY